MGCPPFAQWAALQRPSEAATVLAAEQAGVGGAGRELEQVPELRNGQPAAQSNKARKDHMSPEARKRQADRMRAYWAERRAKKAAGAAKKSAGKRGASAAKRKGGMSTEARKAQGKRMKAYWAAKRAEKQAATNEASQGGPGLTNGASTSKTSKRKAGRTQGRKK